jgi:hypothetical protein
MNPTCGAAVLSSGGIKGAGCTRLLLSLRTQLQKQWHTNSDLLAQLVRQANDNIDNCLMSAQLPGHLMVAQSMESAPGDELPPEIIAGFHERGFSGSMSINRIKISFHETLLVEFTEEIPAHFRTLGERSHPKKVIVQILGAQVIDKPIYRMDCLLTRERIIRATQLAREAGVAVPNICFAGRVSKRGAAKGLDFLVYEFVLTQTVEDEVCAPDEHWGSEVQGCLAMFASRPLTNVNTEPLPRFDTVFSQFSYLRELALEIRALDIYVGLQRLETSFRDVWQIEPVEPVLIHQVSQRLLARPCSLSSTFLQRLACFVLLSAIFHAWTYTPGPQSW